MLPAVGLILGIVMQDAVGVPFLLSALLVVIGMLFVFSAARRRRAVAMVFLVAFASGALLHRRVTDQGFGHVGVYAGSEPRLVRLRGRVETEPRRRPPPEHPFSRWSFGRERTVFLLEAERIRGERGWIETRGRLQVFVDEPLLALRAGDRVEVTGWLRALSPPRNPGGFSWDRYARRRGIEGGLSCAYRENVRIVERHPRRSSWRRTFRRRAEGWLLGGIEETGEETGGLLEALILGRRSQLSRLLDEQFVRAGCAHLIAVSGLHLAVPVAFVWWLGRRLSFSSRTCAAIALGTVVLYVLLAEPRPPILRAAILAAFLCASVWWGRRSNAVNALAGAAIVLLVLTPYAVFDAGFQLSFAAVLGIVTMSGPLHRAAREARRWFERVILHHPHAESDR
ncbi:MAG: ComEC family competence protein, partial [Planctomycetota bacterium]